MLGPEFLIVELWHAPLPWCPSLAEQNAKLHEQMTEIKQNLGTRGGPTMYIYTYIYLHICKGPNTCIEYVYIYIYIYL